jgi:hypothetical protein
MTQGGVKIAERLPQDHVVYAVTLRLSERAQQALTRTIWNDGIDIDVPSLDAKRFAWLIATPYIEELSQLEEQVRQLQERAEQAEVQLAGCGVAALGWSNGEQRAKQGDYGWSASYQDVLNLREKWECSGRQVGQLREALDHASTLLHVGFIEHAIDTVDEALASTEPKEKADE